MKVAISRKILVTLAGVLLLAAAVTLVDIPWSQANGSESTVQLASEGSLATLTVDGIQPGDAVTRAVTIRNDAAAAMRLSFTEQADPATVQDGALALSIHAGSRTLFAGQFGSMLDLTQDMGLVAPGDAVTFEFVVSLPDETTFQPGEGGAAASYAWSLTPA